MSGRFPGFISRSCRWLRSKGTLVSATIRLAGYVRSLSSSPLIRLLPRLILAADHRMTHWGRLPESRTEVTRPDRFDIGKHLASACLIVDGVEHCLCTRPRSLERSPRPRMWIGTQRVNTPLTAENEGQISRVSAHWVLNMHYGDI